MFTVFSVCPPTARSHNGNDNDIDRAICWWTLGNGFAYGTDAGGFIGTDRFAFTETNFTGNEQGMAYAEWFFQWAFAGEWWPETGRNRHYSSPIINSTAVCSSLTLLILSPIIVAVAC